MSDPKADLFLVGSIPLDSVEEVFRTCGKLLGGRVASLPDGEVGDRVFWIIYLAYRVYHGHPLIETIQRPGPVDGVEQWKPTSMDDVWSFRLSDEVKKGRAQLRFDTLHYADPAIESYRTFRKVRSDGGIPAGVRFQVALPFPQDATYFFFRDTSEHEPVMAAYEEAMNRELDRIFAEIPAEDLAIQWDVCTDILEMTGKYYSWSRPESAWDRYVEPLRRLPRRVPEDALLGFHFCYGTFPTKPAIPPDDLGLSVRFANAAVEESGRRVDFVHMTVPIDRKDRAYFRPLEDLRVGDAKVYLGVINEDGPEGAKERIAAAKRYLPQFGIAAECGFGREEPARIPEVLRLHKEVADAVL